MPALIEVKYFNSFVLKKSIKPGGSEPMWDGSRGIPQVKGGYSRGATTQPNQWAIEESRIRGGYNNTTVDFGVKAYLVEDEPNASNRINSMIYSGIFNSRTGINQTNVFSVGEEITKSVDPANGSIQKLYAEDTNLNIFQELKVSRALIDKDAIYSAEGGGAVTSSNLVIGAIQPYSGKYGISNDPTSFAVYGYQKYFSDKNNNAILRLSGNGIEEISKYGMVDFWRDNLNSIDVLGLRGIVIGGYDIHNKQYVVNIKQNQIKNLDANYFKTLSFDESVKGWNSFYSYNPDTMFSLRNKFYTIFNGALYQHYSTQSVNTRGNFYGINYPSSVTLILNQNPESSKTFKTIQYEGSNGWQVDFINSDSTGEDIITLTPNLNWGNNQDTTDPNTNPITPSVYSYTQGQYDSLGNSYPNALQPPFYYAGFSRKENKYVAGLVNKSPAASGEVVFGDQITGIKGFFATAKISTDTVTNLGGQKTIFNVSSEFTINNGY